MMRFTVINGMKIFQQEPNGLAYAIYLSLKELNENNAITNSSSIIIQIINATNRTSDSTRRLGISSLIACDNFQSDAF